MRDGDARKWGRIRELRRLWPPSSRQFPRGSMPLGCCMCEMEASCTDEATVSLTEYERKI